MNKLYFPGEFSANTQKGEVAERIVKDYYRSKGWKVIKLQKHKKKQGVLNYVIDYNALSNLNNYQKIMNDLSVVNEELKKDGKEPHYPDLVCEKDDIVRFIEVKSKVMSLGKVMQRDTLQELVILGYEVRVVMINVDMEEMQMRLDQPDKAFVDFYESIDDKEEIVLG